jgi:formamidopyrimidine-DNA glycosylase
MDKKHKKKLKRAQKKKKDRAQAQEATTRIKQQMNMFDRLPGECSACGKTFPKTREAHMSWQVVVRTVQQLVRLFCPDCQALAKEMAEREK